MATTTRSRKAPTKRAASSRRKPTASRPPGRASLLDPDVQARLKLTPEVAWYLHDRKIKPPTCPPRHKTPEPGEVDKAAVFDPDRVDRVLASFRRLSHTKGQWAGRPLIPDPWEIAYIIAPVFGWVRWDRDSKGYVRCCREAYVDVPRKNGKSTIVGGLGIYLTCADGEQGAEVVTAATTIKQARYVFDPIRRLAEKSPALAPYVLPKQTRIVHNPSGSYIEVVSSVAEAAHGGNLHGGLVDELHVHKSADLLEAIETGTGSRTQPLVVIITTADDGRPGTVYARKRDYIEKLSRRVFKDSATYGVIWCADATDDPHKESTWKKANPGYGVSPTRDYMRTTSDRARNSPAELSSFLRFNLGIRIRQAKTYIRLADWDRSAGLAVDETKLVDRIAYGGLDLSSVEDVTALCWTLPVDDDATAFDVIWRFWLPEEQADEMSKRTAKESEVWVREGRLILTPGNVIDNEWIIEQALRDAEMLDVQSIGYDPWHANEVVRRLGEEGLTCIPVRQGFQSMTQPMKEMLRAVLSGTYRHGGNPVMRWMIDNLAVKMDPAGNVKPDKATSAEKIDGVSAALNALREVLDTKAAPQGEVWVFSE